MNIHYSAMMHAFIGMIILGTVWYFFECSFISALLKKDRNPCSPVRV